MLKPANYDATNARTMDFDRPPAAAYVMQIYQAHEMRSKDSHRPMLVLLMDIIEGRYAGYFNKLFNHLKSKNQFAKWPCVYRRCTDGDQTAYFKGDVIAIEKSNNFTWDFEVKSLPQKRVGCMLGEKEIDQNGRTILEPRFLCSVQTARAGKLHPPKIHRFQHRQNMTVSNNDDDSMYPNYQF